MKYYERFDDMIIVAMSVTIILCLAGAVALQYVVKPAGYCNPAEYTYCGEIIKH
jgi:hypothetical protein